jgi:ABC-type antimicrobial peptide transport system permease subunit
MMLFLVLSGLEMLIAVVVAISGDNSSTHILVAIWLAVIGILVEIHSLEKNA